MVTARKSTKSATQKAPAKPAEVKKSRIPDFKTLEEEVQFWDDHDTTEFEDEFEPIDDDIEFILLRQQPKTPMTVRLETDIHVLLKQEALSQGVGPSTLARMAILTYLKDSGRGTIIRNKAAARRKQPKRAKGAA